METTQRTERQNWRHLAVYDPIVQHYDMFKLAYSLCTTVTLDLCILLIMFDAVISCFVVVIFTLFTLCKVPLGDLKGAKIKIYIIIGSNKYCFFQNNELSI